jgi:dihydroorotate dehydrogenase (NAD+) catalytic subunit
VAVGTANFTDPSTSLSVIQGIDQYMVDEGFASMTDLVGSLVIGKE